MSDSLDVIIVDDDPMVCSVIKDMIQTFYVWGDVRGFTNVDEAYTYCQQKKASVAIFVLDVYMGSTTGFTFLDAIMDKFPMAYEDTIIMTGHASDDIVNMCIASNITYLIEKPIRAYSLQLAVRAIVGKYLRFAKRILEDPVLAETVSGF
ncbi:MAG: response regulator [Deltaproteobacteria bacterium HGW-Deltaproteobacteria-19]|jgi:DNA-binding NtrC family response regulator|nr:MAG: response regulator [Deltaproteobacteria bacterium HGW-Deltaproteobacteria-19]